jgi:hypothetical protein
LGSSCLHPTVPGSQTHAAAADTHQWATKAQIHDISHKFHPPLGSAGLFSIRRSNLLHLQNGTLSFFYDSVKPVHIFICELGRDNVNAHIFNGSFSCLNQLNHSKVLSSSQSTANKSCFNHFTCYQCKFLKF